jgi:hypothetical protein
VLAADVLAKGGLERSRGVARRVDAGDRGPARLVHGYPGGVEPAAFEPRQRRRHADRDDESVTGDDATVSKRELLQPSVAPETGHARR